MKVTISAHFVEKGKVGGAEHMLYNLVKGLIECNVDINILCNSKLQFDEEFVINVSKHVKFFELNQFNHRFITEQLSCIKFGKELKSDVILFPNYYTPLWVPKSLGKVCTVIHDFQYRHFPQYFSNKKRLALYLAHYFTCKRADKVILISEHAKSDVEKFYNTAVLKKVEVIPNPISWERFEVGLASISRNFEGVNYLLCVAAQYPHKNVKTIIHAFKDISQQFPNLKLVLVGQVSDELVGIDSNKQVNLKKIIGGMSLTTKVIITGYLDNASLGWLYQNAKLFLFPSVFEGFGMPPVEALGFGVPTITTKCASIPEVTHGFATYVNNPMDSNEWAAKITHILQNESDSAVKKEDSLQLKSFYDPKVIANKYLLALAD